MALEKYCKDCGELRPASEFTRDRTRTDGLSFYCKTHARRRLLVSKDARKGPPKRRHHREVVVPEGHKWCPDCGTVKPLDEFVRNAGMPLGRAPYCRPCHNIRGKASKEKMGGSRTYRRLRWYVITAQDAEAMLAAQGGLCAICRSAPAAQVDHDHETGAVRALLCFNCNGGLGRFKDDPVALRAAADYVEEHLRRQRSRPLRTRRDEVTAHPAARRRSGSRRSRSWSPMCTRLQAYLDALAPV